MIAAGRCALRAARVYCAVCRRDRAWRDNAGLPERCPEGMDGPGLVEKVANLAHASAEEAGAIAHGVPPVSEAEAARRMGICEGCEWLLDGLCQKCGCAMRRKTAWRSQHCPLGKW